MDGTLFPLALRPQTSDVPDYSRGRKHPYSISVCDDKQRIWYINAGWPGTAHDNRIFKNSKIYQQATLFFSSWKYYWEIWHSKTCGFAFRLLGSHEMHNKLHRDEELFNDAMKAPASFLSIALVF